jgi:hypothetical protein
MELPRIFSATLGLSPPWQVSEVIFADDGRRLDITVIHEACSACPRLGARHEAPCVVEQETWFHHSFFRYATYLHSRVPHSECRGKLLVSERPWARSGSKFVKLESVMGDESSENSANPS